MKFQTGNELPIPHGWYFVGYSDELNQGDVKRLFYFDRELVLYRGDSGTPHLMSAYCPHLGAHLGRGGKVEGEGLRCPFHGWRFDEKGACVEIPYAKRIPPRAKQEKCLERYPLEEASGILWAWFHPEGAPPRFGVEVMPEMEGDDWMPFQKFAWTIGTHIQETGENAADTAHFITVHKLENLGDQGNIEFREHRRLTDIKFGFPKMTNPQESMGDFPSGEVDNQSR